MKLLSFQMRPKALSHTVCVLEMLKGSSTCEERSCWLAWELLMPTAGLLSS